MPPARTPLADRFWAKVDVPDADTAWEDECWAWAASLDGKGYGQMSKPGGGHLRAHRVAYELVVGPIPDGLQLDHLCRNRACVNPAHLEPVTPRVNIMRGDGPEILRQRHAARTHCVNGHPFNEENTARGVNGRVCRECARQRSLRYWRSKNAPHLLDP